MNEPPASVMKDESSAAESAVKRATQPAMINDRITEGPASPEATPTSTKMPAPMMAPILTAAADHTPSVRFSSGIYTFFSVRMTLGANDDKTTTLAALRISINVYPLHNAGEKTFIPDRKRSE